MFNLFGKKPTLEKEPEWLNEIKETQERFFVFIEKLEAKMDELGEAALPELAELFQTDDDLYKRSHDRMLNGLLGQLQIIRKKANDTQDDKIEGLYQSLCHITPATSPYYNRIWQFRNDCSDRVQELEEKQNSWADKMRATAAVDYETQYQNILHEYDTIKNKFQCRQCGGNITIKKIFLIDAHITCDYCGTQNTFEPSTHAKMLQHIAPHLAIQRTLPLYNEWQEEYEKERILYHKKHENRVLIDDDNATKQKKKLQNDQYEAERQAAIRNAPVLEEAYIKAKYAAWISITPDFEQHLLTRMENEIGSVKRSMPID